MPQPLALATYDAANQLTQRGASTLTYDANGNLTSDGANTHVWDARNQLSSISGSVSASFQYDRVWEEDQQNGQRQHNWLSL